MNIDQLRETKLFKSTRAKFNDVEYYYTEVEPALVEQSRKGASLDGNLENSFIWRCSEKGHEFWSSVNLGAVI